MDSTKADNGKLSAKRAVSYPLSRESKRQVYRQGSSHKMPHMNEKQQGLSSSRLDANLTKDLRDQLRKSKSDGDEKLPVIANKESQQITGMKKLRRLVSEPSGQIKQQMNSIPALPLMTEQQIAIKYPLANKYFKRWQSCQPEHHHDSSCKMIREDEREDDEESVESSACLDLLARFPSSPEFSAVLHDLCKRDTQCDHDHR